jgi:hypothetical protein
MSSRQRRNAPDERRNFRLRLTAASAAFVALALPRSEDAR